MRKNLIWVVIDSVRTFKTNADDRDRLDFMDEFGKESVEFLKAFTSAPSSILSGAALFTGMPSCFIARHFSDWQFDREYVLSLQDVLAGYGYTNYAIHNSKEDREVMRDLIHPISPMFYPKGISHGKWWTNHQLNQILEKILQSGFQQPAFFMLWYDCRNDPQTSERVKQGMQLFNKFDLYEDSIILLNSDHGYPDPRSGLTESSMRSRGHSMVVTDDNIQVPLFFKCPGYRPRKVQEMVGLIDLFPTILNLLNIDCNDPRIRFVKGRDLSPLMAGQEWESEVDRIIRVDTRLLFAPGRITALRTNTYKYVYYHDENIESLYDLQQDPLELRNLLEGIPLPENEALRLRFRTAFDKMQDELYQFHGDELLVAFDRNVARLKERLNIKRMLFLSTAPLIFLNLTAQSFRNAFPGIMIDLMVHKNNPLGKKAGNLFDHIITLEKITTQSVKEALKDRILEKYDVVLLITEQSSIYFDNPMAYKVARLVGRRVLLVDYNMKFYNRMISQWSAPLRKFVRNWYLYKQEPTSILTDAFNLVRRGFRVLIRRKNWGTLDIEKARKMRDRAILAQEEAKDL
ncbi:sulfatase/phosphatase domain-containing protein [Chloroflexota bacterium]